MQTQLLFISIHCATLTQRAVLKSGILKTNTLYITDVSYI
jgi:hypothetical protein